MKQYYFLGSLPRTGSTLLASLLNQHPDVYASATSALLDLLIPMSNAISFNRGMYEINDEQEINIYRGIVDSFYKHIDKTYIFDKHRVWPDMVNPLKKMGFNYPKMIITLRPIPEIITSYITLIDKNPNDKNNIDELVKAKGWQINNNNRAMVIWTEYIVRSHTVINNAIKNGTNNFLFIQYDDIINNPNDVLNRVCDFTGIPKYDGYDFNKIENKNKEKDDGGWAIKDLHKIRPILQKQSANPEDVIGKSLVDHFNQFNIKI